jgi:hypothetical protein
VAELDRDFMEALTAGIDLERVAEGDTPGWPYTAAEWDNAAASSLAACIFRAPFDQRRRVLVGMLAGLVRDGFFQSEHRGDTFP